MTTEFEIAQTTSQAREIKDRAIEWLERCERVDFTDDNREDLENWLSESLSHRVAFWHAKSAWERAERLKILHPRPGADKAREGHKLWSTLARSAAAVAILGILVSAAMWMAVPRGRTLSTAHGEREVVSLADGSKIELNTDTEVRVMMQGGQRLAELVRGEAYFQIQHDELHPFIVVAGDHRIRDLGTKFLVKKSDGELRVALINGRAEVEQATDKGVPKSVVLAPGDVALATTTEIRVTRKPVRELADDLAWRHGGLVFHNASLAEAVAEFNRYGVVKLVIADPHAGKLTINGAFRTTGAENFAGVAHEIFGLHVDRRDNDIILSR